MSQTAKTTLVTLLTIVSMMLPGAGNAEERSVSPQSHDLVDGLYLVTRKGDTQAKLRPVDNGERLLVDDGHFLEPADRNPTEYVVIDTKASIPFALSKPPVEDHESSGKPRLQIQFAPKQAAALEQLTGKNVGRTVAIVIGGEIVTCHKIREAVTGGNLQITRCTKHGCDLIYSRLLKDHH